MPDDRKEPLGILKMVWGLGRDGKLAIQGVAPLYLRPAVKNADEDFFAIGDDIFGVQPNVISTIAATLGQSIVPIVAVVPGEGVMRCLGTGFFVSGTGLLITAAHVVLDPIERDYGDVREVGELGWDISALNLGVMVATNPLFQQKGWIFQKIEWASLLATKTDGPLPFGKQQLKLTTDTAICGVSSPPASMPFQPLSIVQPGIRGAGLAVGKSCLAIGYGAMADVELEEHENGSISGDFKFELYAATGTILERFPNNDVDRQVRTPGPCFSASIKLPPGMSGSPIFDDERIYVHGVVSSGWQDEAGIAKLGYGSMLASSMSLPIPPLADRSLLDLLIEGDQGMAKLSIAGA